MTGPLVQTADHTPDRLSPIDVAVNLLWCVPGRVGGSEQYLVRQLVGLADQPAHFIPTIYFGVLTGLAMSVALLAALTLLPKLILITRPFGCAGSGAR